VYTLTDPAGLPLDATGVTTPGAISLGYIAAVLPNNQQTTRLTPRVPIRGLRLRRRISRVPIPAARLPADRASISTSSIPRRPPDSIRPPPILSASMRPVC
jgi:hypothetical protein